MQFHCLASFPNKVLKCEGLKSPRCEAQQVHSQLCSGATYGPGSFPFIVPPNSPWSCCHPPSDPFNISGLKGDGLSHLLCAPNAPCRWSLSHVHPQTTRTDLGGGFLALFSLPFLAALSTGLGRQHPSTLFSSTLLPAPLRCSSRGRCLCFAEVSPAPQPPQILQQLGTRGRRGGRARRPQGRRI